MDADCQLGSAGRDAGSDAGRQTTTTMPALVSQRPWNVNGIQNVAGGGTWTAAAAARRRQEGTGCAVQTEPERTAKRAAPIDIASDASDAGNANKLAQAEAVARGGVGVGVGVGDAAADEGDALR